MDTIILQALENIRCGFLDVFFSIITVLGEEITVAGVIAVIFMCFNKEVGERALISVLSASCVTTAVKSAVRRPRPFTEEAGPVVGKVDNFLTKGLNEDMSFPSGHATASSAFFASLSIRFRKAYVIAPCAVMTLLVVLSRLYLGVHYPTDVLAGLAVGIGMAFIWQIVYHGFYAQRLYIYLVFAALTLILLFIPATQSESMFKISALTLATAVGLILEEKFIRFENTDKWWKRGVRLALMALMAAIPYLLLSLLPEYLWFKFLQYFLTVLIAMNATPFLIKLFHI